MDVVRAFALARAAVERLPESVGRALFSAAGTAMGLSGSAGARRLRANQARIRPGLGPVRARLLSAAAMRSYMRYYYECFRLPVLGEDRILARVQLDNDAELRADLASGRSATAALVHAGNWDMAGAWACIDLAPVHTLAERLEPAGLYEDFLRFRTGLGMTIYPVVRGGGGLRALEEDMAAGVCFTPILADRDLTASGVEVRLAGHAMLVAPGPALLAQRTGCAIYPVFSRYERLARRRRAAAGTRWGLRLTVGEPVRAETTPDSDSRERAADVRRMSQEWMDQFEPWLRAHLEDWHMLQRVFVSDLDPERLARARARAAEEGS
ncbi:MULTISPECIES: phosphatidylinositol mannoside acyltransferase [Actinomycetaceae]|jgi:lipid A biosynthesis lauroyl acyltransferase|uniref:phosphatidylinositol mannoside acyltransferase n=1 Tax=Actinomycetaceae TaxID=2049 RepID=UPI00058B1EDE|nr:phosphatidylinositol mannoside acyltransferase [Actinobaculum sp. oral taxon 183]RKV68197.1 MAG: phosphatidylinositol mannoside acyltransferase [Actinomyces sp.]